MMVYNLADLWVYTMVAMRAAPKVHWSAVMMVALKDIQLVVQTATLMVVTMVCRLVVR